MTVIGAIFAILLVLSLAVSVAGVLWIGEVGRDIDEYGSDLVSTPPPSSDATTKKYVDLHG